jgi:VanZ family protein
VSPAWNARLRAWGPAAFCLAVIATLSSIPGSHLGVPLFHGADKLIHGSEYALLSWLALRGVLLDPFLGRRGGFLPLVVMFLALLALAGADEWHQQFIPGRSCDAADWAADAVGATLGLLVRWGWTGRRRREAK